MKKQTNESQAMRAGIITIIVNIAITIFKLVAGIVGGSTAMVADAMHSFSDLYTTIIVMVGIKLANKSADKNHPYGHERFECVAAIILSVVLIFVGGGIGWAGVNAIISRDFMRQDPPGVIALVAALASIAAAGMLYIYKRAVAKRIASGALKADAFHHLSDSLSSIGSLLGILGARHGLPILDPIAAIVICLFIFKVALDVFRDAIGKMTDKSCDSEMEDALYETVLAQEGVVGVDELKTRLFGDKAYVDIEISADGTLTLYEAHEIAHRVHDAIENQFKKVKHCGVHVNPASNTNTQA